jgi:short-subunit dehydrogenase
MNQPSPGTAVIVGASSGIGEALAHELSRAGWRLGLPERPLPTIVRRLFVASPEKAAKQILRAIQKRKKHAYTTKRYAPIAFILKLLPRPG